jgi:hypothetical protein
MTPVHEGPSSPKLRPASWHRWRLLGLPAAAAFLAFGLARALPEPKPAAAEVPPVVGPVCAEVEPELALPPGHPPVEFHGRALRLALPPGHPPIRRGDVTGPWAPPLRTHQAGPAVYDI